MASHLEFSLPDHETMVTCPYNKAHQVVKHRMPKHLIKCRRSHGGYGAKECRFNATHVLPFAEIEYHEANCPDRLTVELFMTAAQTEKKPLKRKKPLTDSGLCDVSGGSVKDEDDWDNMPEVQTYNPKKKCEQSDVWRHVQHQTPLMRKEMREEERERLSDIREKAAKESVKVKEEISESGSRGYFNFSPGEIAARIAQELEHLPY